ncbi:hypothetical protein PC121_g16421 [Phytophthora cactorum]|nr:hypothetical protein PC121_g16421 [Phytophthora cactorum]KAG4049194.1 hypothetical protein PC123_g15509 [Phytophthora cactorum]
MSFAGRTERKFAQNFENFQGQAVSNYSITAVALRIPFACMDSKFSPQCFKQVTAQACLVIPSGTSDLSGRQAHAELRFRRSTRRQRTHFMVGPPVRLVEESKGVTKKISRCWSPRRSMSSLSIKLPESLPNTFQIKDRQIIK